MTILKPKHNPTPSSQAGFTIIESLMAIILVSILMVAIAPVIVLSVATRVQARRLEMGSNAAKAFIDGVRSGAIAAPPLTTAAPDALASTAGFDCPAPGTPPGTPPPKMFYCGATTTPSTNLFCMDNDGETGCDPNSLKDMVIHTYGVTPLPGLGPDKGYVLGVRVYRAEAFKDGTGLQNQTAARSVAGGLGNVKAPLIETTTEIASPNTTLRDLCNRLRPDPANPNPNSACQ